MNLETQKVDAATKLETADDEIMVAKTDVADCLVAV
jgi:hypothetical protein